MVIDMTVHDSLSVLNSMLGGGLTLLVSLCIVDLMRATFDKIHENFDWGLIGLKGASLFIAAVMAVVYATLINPRCKKKHTDKGATEQPYHSVPMSSIMIHSSGVGYY
jgi:hypothetical protein